MRRLLWFLLVILLLAGCEPVASYLPQTETPPVEGSPVATASPSMVFTHEKFDPGETDNPRWYAETTVELLPRGDYGELYPFPGSLLTRSDPGTGAFFWELSDYGFCTADGTVVCDPAFNMLDSWEYDGKVCYTFRRSRGCGEQDVRENTVYLAAGDGRFVLAFDEVEGASEGAFAVRKGDKWGAVDYDGNTLLPCVYQNPMYFGDGLAAVTYNLSESYEYVDREGNTVFTMPVPAPMPSSFHYEEWEVPEVYEELDVLFTRFFWSVTFQEGRAVFETTEGLYGYVDREGNVAIPARFRKAEKFYQGVALVTEEGRTFVIDRNGQEVTALGPDISGRIGDYFYRRLGTEHNFAWEYVDINGLPVSEEEAENWWRDDSRMIYIYEEEKYGYADLDGSVLIPPVYDKLEQVGDCFMAQQGRHVGLLDGAGEWIVKRHVQSDEE